MNSIIRSLIGLSEYIVHPTLHIYIPLEPEPEPVQVPISESEPLFSNEFMRRHSELFGPGYDKHCLHDLYQLYCDIPGFYQQINDAVRDRMSFLQLI